ncbi:NADP-dependent oxidoreductase [Actinoplanes sp. NPDC000266]
MRAAAFDEPGPPEVLREMEVPTPEAGAGEVRVRIRAAGVQPYDCAVREGWNPAGAPPGFPRIPGNEFAGVVDQGDAEGQEVIGFGMLGAYAEYIVVPAHHVTAKPSAMPWEVAGGFSAGAQTAHIALLELGVNKGDTLLIHGAAGAVGTVAVQLGLAWGATVIGTAAPANHDYLRELGAVPIAYGEGLSSRVHDVAPHGVDAVLDGAGGEALDLSLRLTPNVLTLVDHGREGVKVTPPLRSRERLAELAGMYADGLLRVHVRAAYPLARAAGAHRDVGSGHGRGKVVITV